MAMSETIGQAWVDIRARMDKLGGDVDKATVMVQGKMGAALDGTGQATDRLGGKLNTATKGMLALGATGASMKIAGVLKNAGDAASDLGEAANANSVAFKDGAGVIDAFAKNALDKVGLAEVTVRNLATGIGAMFTAVGMTGKDAAKMTQDLITRAVDVGSVFNESADVVTQAFGSALRGESEPARRFGVFLSADAIAAEAMSIGLVKATVPVNTLKDAQNAAAAAVAEHAKAVKEYGANSAQATEAGKKMEAAEATLASVMKGKTPVLTDAQKMQAAYSIVMRQTASDAGDYTKTADSKANADRRASEAAKEASASLGTSLAPIMAKVSDLAAKIAKAFSDLPGPVQTVVAGLLLLGVLAGPIGSIVTLLGALGIVGPAAGAGAAAAGAGGATAGGGFMAMAAGVWAAMVPLLPIILLIAAVIAIGVLLWKNWDTIKAAAAATWGWIKDFLGSTFGFIKDNWMLMLGPIGLIIKYWDDVKKAAGVTWDWIWGKISGFVDFIKGVPEAIAGALGGIWDTLKEGFKAAWNFIAGTMNKADFTIPSWVPVVGGKTFGYPDLPMLATGGTATASGWSVVGENGPELNYMPKGASVVPLGRGGPGGGSLTIVVQGSVLTERNLIEVVRDGLLAKGFSNGGAFRTGSR